MTVHISRRIALVAFVIIVAIVTGLVGTIFHVQQVARQQTCDASIKVRSPLLAYIGSTVPLERTARELQAAEAQLQPAQSAQLASLQAQLNHLQGENFRNLIRLRDALRSAVATGCSE
jgi:uncharacterized protein HemX